MIIKRTLLFFGVPSFCVCAFVYGGSLLLSFGNMMFRPYVYKTAKISLMLFGIAALLFLYISLLGYFRKRGARHALLAAGGILSGVALAVVLLAALVVSWFILYLSTTERIVFENNKRYVLVSDVRFGEFDYYPLRYPYVNFLIMDKRFISPV